MPDRLPRPPDMQVVTKGWWTLKVERAPAEALELEDRDKRMQRTGLTPDEWAAVEAYHAARTREDQRAAIMRALTADLPDVWGPEDMLSHGEALSAKLEREVDWQRKERFLTGCLAGVTIAGAAAAIGGWSGFLPTLAGIWCVVALLAGFVVRRVTRG